MFSIMPNGFIVRLSDGVIIPNDISNNDYKKYLDWKSLGNEPSIHVPTQLSGATKITRLKARLAMADKGVLDQLESWIATQPQQVKVLYEDSDWIFKDNSIVKQAALALNWSDAFLTELFTLAASL
ncbi:hypothetical protein [Methylomonas sp. 11b]|uniref:hypothetical protein n=1 Tax=Methylomonas sp. 11b TaxID=1168169 RepID=UPI00047DAE80|nr:hypothetical protein [Methylomonas sp. 11b]